MLCLSLNKVFAELFNAYIIVSSRKSFRGACTESILLLYIYYSGVIYGNTLSSAYYILSIKCRYTTALLQRIREAYCVEFVENTSI